MATETVKWIVGIGESLKDRLLLFDALRMRFQTVRITKNHNCLLCGDNPKVTELIDYQAFVNASSNGNAPSEPSVPTVTVGELQQAIANDHNITLLDVREAHEWEIVHIEGAKLLPLSTLPAGLDSLPKDSKVFVHCHHGKRSEKAVQLMQQQGFTDAVSVEGGIDAWAEQINPSLPRY